MARRSSDTSAAKEIFIPVTYPVVPLRNMVFFPKQIVPISIGREISLRALESAQNETTPILIVAQREGNVTNPSISDLHLTGTIANVLKIFTLPDNTKSALIQGVARARVMTFTQSTPFIRAVAQRVDDEQYSDIEVEALASAVKNVFRKVV